MSARRAPWSGKPLFCACVRPKAEQNSSILKIVAMSELRPRCRAGSLTRRVHEAERGSCTKNKRRSKKHGNFKGPDGALRQMSTRQLATDATSRICFVNSGGGWV